MDERDIRIKPNDFEALYKILVCARTVPCSLEPWERAFEEELYLKLARRLARRQKGRGPRNHAYGTPHL